MEGGRGSEGLNVFLYGSAILCLQKMLHCSVGSLKKGPPVPVEVLGVVERVDGWGESAVQAEDAVLDQRRHGQVVEQVGEELPHVGVAVLALALVVEAVHLRRTIQ